jgi:hypothetical protein
MLTSGLTAIAYLIFCDVRHSERLWLVAQVGVNAAKSVRSNAVFNILF